MPRTGGSGVEDAAAADVVIQRHQRLVRRTLLVSALTFVSRILGFVREVVSAILFGDRSAVFDAFITAWRVPNLFRRFLGDGAMGMALQAALTDADASGGNEAGRRLFLRTLGLTSWLLLGLCAVVMVAVSLVPDAMPLTGWHWLGADPEPVRELTVRLMPFVILICLSALVTGGLQVRGHFFWPAMAPVVMNVAWIGTLLVVAWRFQWQASAETTIEAAAERQMEMVELLSWGVLIAGLLQLAVQLPALKRFGLAFGRGLAANRSAQPTGAQPAGASTPWAVLRSSLPLALGAAVYQVNVLVDGLMAEGLLPDGGPTAHYYAYRIQQFPLALIAIAATSAVFPALKALGRGGRTQELRALHDRTQLAVSFLALPASVGLLVLAGPIAAVLFQHGAYGPEGVARLSAALGMLALALVPAGAVGLTSRAYYGLGDLRTPVRVSMAMAGANVVLNLVFVVGLGMDVDGLALATALTSWGNLLLLLPGLWRKHGLAPTEDARFRRLVPVAGASLLAGLLARAAYDLVAAPGSVPFGFLEALVTGSALAAPRSAPAHALSAVVGVGSFLLMAELLGVPEWRHLRARVRARSRRGGSRRGPGGSGR